MTDAELKQRWESAAALWKVETQSGVVVYPMRASVQALANLGCDVSGAVELLRVAEDQYEHKDYDGLLVTFARLNNRLAPAIEAVRLGEPTTWAAYRESLPAGPPERKGVIARSAYLDRVRGAWMGKCIGTALGDPVEGWTRHQIQARYGRIDRFVSPPKTENDDTAYPILVLHALDEYGPEFTSEELGLEWVAHLPSAFTAEQAALENLRAGVMPPESRWRGNPCGAWVGGQMRGEIHGLIAPMEPGTAAGYAFRDAAISHYREGLHAEVYAAALTSLAFCESRIETLLTDALAFVPASSPVRRTVEHTIEWCHRFGDWQAVAERIEKELGHYHWIHALPNLGCVVCGLMFGEGNFERTLLTTLACGHDTDCSAGQAAALIGALVGADELPRRWTEPIGGTLETYVLGFERITLDRLAGWTVAWGERIVPGRIEQDAGRPRGRESKGREAS